MNEPLRIDFDNEGRAILEMTREAAELLREALQIAVEVDGVLKADLTQVASASAFFARIDDPPCRPPRFILGFARIDDPPCRREVEPIEGIPRVGMKESEAVTGHEAPAAEGDGPASEKGKG